MVIEQTETSEEAKKNKRKVVNRECTEIFTKGTYLHKHSEMGKETRVLMVLTKVGE